MDNGDDIVTLTCPRCGQEIQKGMADLQTNPVFPHQACGAILEFDHSQYIRRNGGDRVEGQPDLSLILISR
jgi:hypothetical protein